MTVRATVAATRELPTGSTAVPLSPREVEPDCQAPVVWDSKSPTHSIVGPFCPNTTCVCV